MRKILFLFCICSWSWTSVYAALATDDNEINYDSIVSQLSRSNRGETFAGDDPFGNVQIHFGAGLANTAFSINHKDGSYTNATQRGVQANLGIDLFSPEWMAEGCVVNYGEKEYDKSYITLREFDLRLVYHTRMEQTWGLRTGAGLAARYLNVKTKNHTESQEYSTPASVIFGGIDAHISRKLSLGAEIATRNALTSDTPDQSALDLVIRLDGHF